MDRCKICPEDMQRWIASRSKLHGDIIVTKRLAKTLCEEGHIDLHYKKIRLFHIRPRHVVRYFSILWSIEVSTLIQKIPCSNAVLRTRRSCVNVVSMLSVENLFCVPNDHLMCMNTGTQHWTYVYPIHSNQTAPDLSSTR